jgi:lipopolysaccharide assembly outer membrane protein LptD (OstA)
LQADQQGFDLLINRFVATGQVKALLNGGRLLADRLEFDPTSRTVYASGSVRFQRGHEYLQASRLRFNLIQAEGEL